MSGEMILAAPSGINLPDLLDEALILKRTAADQVNLRSTPKGRDSSRSPTAGLSLHYDPLITHDNLGAVPNRRIFSTT